MTEHIINFPAKSGPISLDQLSDVDREILAEIVVDKEVVIDIGTFLGASAEIFAQNQPENGHVYTIDPFTEAPSDLRGNMTREHVLTYATQRLTNHYEDKVTLIVAKSETATKIFPSNFADMVFIDGAHDYEHVCKDIDFALKVIKSDGIIVGHDYDKLAKFPIGIDYINENAHKDWDEESGVHCGVIRAVQEKFSQFGLPREEPESSLWIANPEWKR